jgi:hypothetical protein
MDIPHLVEIRTPVQNPLVVDSPVGDSGPRDSDPGIFSLLDVLDFTLEVIDGVTRIIFKPFNWVLNTIVWFDDLTQVRPTGNPIVD